MVVRACFEARTTALSVASKFGVLRYFHVENGYVLRIWQNRIYMSLVFNNLQRRSRGVGLFRICLCNSDALSSNVRVFDFFLI